MQFGAKPLRQRRARLTSNITDALKAEPAELIDHLAGQPEESEWQPLEQRRALSNGHDNDRLGSRPRKGMGGSPCVSHCRPRRDAGGRQACDHVLEHGILAAMQMRGPARIDHQPIGRIDGDQRRIQKQRP
jgi:hypothetical protein